MVVRLPPDPLTVRRVRIVERTIIRDAERLRLGNALRRSPHDGANEKCIPRRLDVERRLRDPAVPLQTAPLAGITAHLSIIGWLCPQILAVAEPENVGLLGERQRDDLTVGYLDIVDTRAVGDVERALAQRLLEGELIDLRNARGEPREIRALRGMRIIIRVSPEERLSGLSAGGEDLVPEPL